MFGNLFGGGSDIASQSGKLSKQTIQQNNEGMGEIYKAFSGYSPQFYNLAQSQFNSNLLPTIEAQGLQTKELGDYGFANRGLFNSSAADNFANQLSGSMQQQRIDAAQQAIQYRNALQQMVEQEKAKMQGQLQQSLMPNQLMQSTYSATGQMGAPSPFAPIGQGLNTLGNLAMMSAQTKK